MKNKAYLKLLPFMALVSGCITGCGENYDAVLVVYNWQDYIYEGIGEDGLIDEEDPGVCVQFEQYYQEKYGLNIHIDYETFDTNETMYNQLTNGSISADLICPSDYMIQRMANEGLLQKLSYNPTTGYGESLKNWADNGSPFIIDRFSKETVADGSSFLSYALPYFWGTMGFTYDMNTFSPEEVSTWEILWSNDVKYKDKFTLKDSMRDTMVPAIFHIFKDQIAALDINDSDYESKLSVIFNDTKQSTIDAIGDALAEANDKTIFGFEVDDGKSGVVLGTYPGNLAWSGDAVYSMDQGEESGMRLGYSLPEEGSNIWFDGWCIPKSSTQKELAEEFLNFISDPKIAAKSMDAVGYTSAVAGEEIWELVCDWYEAEDDVDYEDVDLCDISYFFGDTIGEKAEIRIEKSERGRQFDAQYPSLEQIKKCAIMRDFGDMTSKFNKMWVDFRGE